MYDKVSLERINKLHPDLREEVLDLYKKTYEILKGNAFVRITQTLRTIEEQDKLYSQGRTAKGKIVTNAKGGSSFHNYGLACYSDDTRVCTSQGLKLFSELNGEEEILTFYNNRLEFQSPTAIISNDYEGELIHITSPNVDLLCTPEHKILQMSSHKSSHSAKWEAIEAQEVINNHVIPLSGYSIHTSSWVPDFIKQENIRDWYEFMGYWIAFGYTSKSNCGFRLEFKIPKDYRPLLRDCIKKFNLQGTYKRGIFSFSHEELWKFLKDQEGLPSEMYKAHPIYLSCLIGKLDLLTLSTEATTILATIRILLDKSSTILTKAKGARLTTKSINKTHLKHASITKVPYKGVVYCVSTEAGSIVVERNGKMFVGGNCDFCLIVNGVEVSWDTVKDYDGDKQADWMEVVKLFKSAGYEWGGDWKFKDQPHFQKSFGYTTKQLFQKVKNKELKDGYVKL